MTETDAFFTHAIVGQPQSIMLGRKLSVHAAARQGLQVDLSSGESALSSVWNEWVILSHATDPVGMPRLRPGRVRGFLERYALLIAAIGLAALVGAAGLAWGYL